MESISDPLNKGSYFSQIQTQFSNWGQNISEKASDLGSRIADVFRSAMKKLKTALNAAADNISTTASNAYQTLEDTAISMYIALFYRSRKSSFEKINIDVAVIDDQNKGPQNHITTETHNVNVHNAQGSNYSINHTNNTSNNEITPSDSDTPENPTEQSDSWKQDAVTLCKIAGTVCTLATLILSAMVWLTSGDGIEQDLTI